MTVNEVVCDLEGKRADELEQLLKPVQEKILEFVRKADTTEGEVPSTIGPSFTKPDDIRKILNLGKFDYNAGELDNKDHVLEVVQSVLDNSINTWHPGFMDKLYAGTNPIGVISDLILSTLNTNSHVFKVSPALTIIEKFIAHKYALKFGFDNDFSGGLTFPGGSWSNVTSLQMARSILFPESKVEGNTKKFAVYTSVHSHYSIEKACILLGLGLKSCFKIKVNDKDEMDTEDLEIVIKKSIADGFTPLYVNATSGTTVFGSYDPLEEISAIAKHYNIWFHIDGSWGGNVIFSNKHKWHLKGSHLADSITANPHKLLGVPATCSFLLVPDERIFQKANSLDAPYLFHNKLDGEENFDLAGGTMGCGRRPDALKFYLAWLYYGEQGFEKRLDHAFEIANYFVAKISANPDFKLVSQMPLPCLQVCYYYYPNHDAQKAHTKEENTKTTRIIANELYNSGKFLVDYSPHSDKSRDEGEFFRVVFNAPSISSHVIDELYNDTIELGKNLKN